MKTHTANHKFFVFTLVIILIVLGTQRSGYGQNLDIGEPGTVRLIYFLPNDGLFHAEAVQRMKDNIRTIQTFYVDQMQAHGYGNMTFRFETDGQGEPMVHRVDGQHPDSYYPLGFRGSDLIREEIERKFDLNANNIYFIVMDDRTRLTGGRTGHGGGGRNGGSLFVPDEFSWVTGAHELGHALGLPHDFRDHKYIMSYGFGDRRTLSACAAEFLSVHPYFNPDISVESGTPPTIELVSPQAYPAGAENIPVRLKVSDPDGLHQVLVLVQTRALHPSAGFLEVKGCQALAGERETIVEFDYDGVIPSYDPISPGYKARIFFNSDVQSIFATAVDSAGNTSLKSFVLFSETLQSLSKISGDNQHGLPNAPLPDPFVVEVRDVNDGSVRSGVPVRFAITAGGGTLSIERTETDYNGRAESTFTLGPNLGTYTVEVSAVGIDQTVTFNAVSGTAVEFPDPNLRAVIETALNKTPGDPVALAEMATLTELQTVNAGISDLTGIEFATNLVFVYLPGNRISDLSPLAELTNLTQLFLAGNLISDISPLAELTNLWELTLWNNSVSDISPLAGLTNLAVLRLTGNNISDISPLAGLTNLQSLHLENNPISDISPLVGLTNLRALNLEDNNISDGSVLVKIFTGLTELIDLHLEGTGIADISPLAELTNLKRLVLQNTNVSDITPLTELTNLTYLHLWNNPISDITALAKLTNLTSLELGGEGISDITPLSELTELTLLELSGTSVSDVEPLAGLTELTVLLAYGNKISDITPLAGLVYLTHLNLADNLISDISPVVGLSYLLLLNLQNNPLSYPAIYTHIPTLQGRGIEVYFDNRDPTTFLKISEIMVASNEGRLPQWIELHNLSDTHAVNLQGWTLEIQNYRSVNFNGHQNVTITFKEKSIKPQETLLIVSKQGRSSNRFRNKQIYNLSMLHPNLQDIVLSEEGFYLKLSSTAGELIDEVGNLDGKRNANDKPAWPLPTSMTEDGVRASMIRRQDNGTSRLGTEAFGWISAVNTKLTTATTTYYGHPDDIGAPGVESGGALPVQLSRFRAELTDAGVLLRWITESELDNAGFYILRSETRNGKFKVVNPQLIQGAGTTSERHIYTWKDTAAKPNVVYYYRIEDVSYTGVRQQLATVRMRGYVSATGKLTTRWGDLKMQE